ncbi:Ubiquitin carboxyl-terminal hydrolase isozyme L1, partial [Chytridiales sp. JEL 0842]
ILGRESKIDPTSGEGLTVHESIFKGTVKLSNATFSYPSIPSRLVLDGFSLKIQPKQTIALVGPSGSGKSTVVAILERWYNTDSGQVDVDGHSINDWNIENLRSHMAIVSQEPILFDMTIRENVSYGSRFGVATQEEIEAACIMAHAHDFISALPEGYNTRVGAKGVQLSGGQKQRLSIARALIRDPKILLLDEATSALDSKSEKVVQASLDAAANNRTTLVIAHRLSTIQNADCIIVLDKGKIVEMGSYASLMQRGGAFVKLVKNQEL